MLGIIVLLHEEFMVDSMTVRCPGPVATKEAPNHQPLTSMCDFWYEVFVLMCSLGFFLNVLLCIMAKHAHSALICSKDIVLEVLYELFRCNFANLNYAAVLFSDRRGFPLASLPNMPYLSHSFLFCTVMYFII